MRRLFTFGCSFTNYHWPTWADILGQQFDVYENWGLSGAGNQFIFNSLIECDLRNHISHNDTVAIMWSNVARDDVYYNGQWQLRGNAFRWDELENNLDRVRGYYIRDLATIHAARLLLDSWDCRYHFMSMLDIDNPVQYEHISVGDDIKDLLTHYQETLKFMLPSVHEKIFNYNWSSRPLWPELSQTEIRKSYEANKGVDWPSWEDFADQKFYNVPQTVLDEIFDVKRWNWTRWLRASQRGDFHPTPSEHLEYINSVLPEYCFDHKLVLLVHEIDAKIRQNKPYDDLLTKFKNSVTQHIKRW